MHLHFKHRGLLWGWLLVAFNWDFPQAQICTKEFWKFRAICLVLHSKTLTIVTNVKFKVIILKEKWRQMGCSLIIFSLFLPPSYLGPKAFLPFSSFLLNVLCMPLTFSIWYWHFPEMQHQNPVLSFHPCFLGQTYSDSFLTLRLRSLTPHIPRNVPFLYFLVYLTSGFLANLELSS